MVVGGEVEEEIAEEEVEEEVEVELDEGEEGVGKLGSRREEERENESLRREATLMGNDPEGSLVIPKLPKSSLVSALGEVPPPDDEPAPPL